MRDGEIFGDVITGAIEDEGGVAARHDPPADLRQMQGHDLGVGGWDDESRRGAALRIDRAEDVGPFVALTARRTRPCSSLGPDAGQRPLLADFGEAISMPLNWYFNVRVRRAPPCLTGIFCEACDLKSSFKVIRRCVSRF